MYERTVFISFSSWYWTDSVPSSSKPGKNFRISKSICDYWGSLQLALPKQLLAKGLDATSSTVSNFCPFETQD